MLLGPWRICPFGPLHTHPHYVEVYEPGVLIGPLLP